jgi:predicted RNase H-like HicB family nuclease
MQYQIFVESQSQQHFVASVMGMPTIAVDGNTEVDAIANAKAALKSQLAKGKIVTIDLDELNSIDPKPITIMQHAGILQADPTYDDWVEKLADIRKSANAVDDEI